MEKSNYMASIYQLRDGQLSIKDNQKLINKIIHLSPYYAYSTLTKLRSGLTDKQREECIKKSCEDEEYLCQIYHKVANKNEKEVLWQKIISSPLAISYYLANFVLPSEMKNQFFDILIDTKDYEVIIKTLMLSDDLSKEKTLKLANLIIEEKNDDAAYNFILFMNNLHFNINDKIITKLLDILFNNRAKIENIITYRLSLLPNLNNYFIEKIVEQNDYELATMFKQCCRIFSPNYERQLSHLLLMYDLTN